MPDNGKVILARDLFNSIQSSCLVPAKTPPPGPERCNPYEDIDFVGNDYITKTNKKASECCLECEKYLLCWAYAWNADNGGTCYLKRGVGQVEYKPGVISGSRLPLTGGVCAVQYEHDYVANDIGNAPAANPGACCGQCKANGACKAYTWSNYNGGTCWMKSGKGATVYKAGVTSGVILYR